MSLSSGTTTRGTPRRPSASAAVSSVRLNSVVTQSSTGSSASSRPRAPACTRPSSVSPSQVEGSPLQAWRTLNLLSAWRARMTVSTKRDGSRVALEEQRAVCPGALHADGLVHPDRRRVLRPHGQADARRPLEQQPAEVAHPAPRVAAPAGARIYPDLLDLHGAGRPRRGLRLEPDHAVLQPEPGAALL